LITCLISYRIGVYQKWEGTHVAHAQKDTGNLPTSSNDAIKLLYVEDESDVRHMIATMLPLMNEMLPAGNWPLIEVIEAANGLAGVEMAKEHLPDIILMDLRLPNMSGTEAAMEIRKDPKTSHIPIIMITAFQEDRVEEAAAQVGAERAMEKPIQWGELMNAIVELTNRQS
jgi:twitching motility two-component system response regulator PilH